MNEKLQGRVIFYMVCRFKMEITIDNVCVSVSLVCEADYRKLFRCVAVWLSWQAAVLCTRCTGLHQAAEDVPAGQDRG